MQLLLCLNSFLLRLQFLVRNDNNCKGKMEGRREGGGGREGGRDLINGNLLFMYIRIDIYIGVAQSYL